MRVLYVAPRYHSNQIPVMSGWLQAGHEVRFISQVSNVSENHAVLTPIVLGYSKWSEKMAWLFCKLTGRKLADDLFAFKTKWCTPPRCEFKKIIDDFKPDVAIFRERSAYTAISYSLCKKRHIDCILYNQTPLYGPKKKSGLRADIKRLFIRVGIFPAVRMTPVLRKEKGSVPVEDNSFYVPFVMEPHFSPEEKAVGQNGASQDSKTVRIVCVALFNKIKRLFELVESLSALKDSYPFTLTIAGEVINREQEEYYANLKKQIAQSGLEDRITLKPNCNRDQVFELLRQADLFILPSLKEGASISQLEAMSCSLPIILSDTNGSTFMVREGYNGYRFTKDTLTEVLDKALAGRDNLSQMGSNSYRMVCEEFSFDCYFKGIQEAINAIHNMK